MGRKHNRITRREPRASRQRAIRIWVAKVHFSRRCGVATDYCGRTRLLSAMVYLAGNAPKDHLSSYLSHFLPSAERDWTPDECLNRFGLKGVSLAVGS